MKHSYTIARSFAAGHSLVGHPMCKSDHGHDWTIAVTVTGQPHPDHWMLPVDPVSLSRQLDALVEELALRNLDKMIPAGTSSTHGVAMYVWDRLLLLVPGLSVIEVGYGQERSRVEP